jgi:predicted small metal-binding protein
MEGFKMGEHKHSGVCPVCGGTLAADSEDVLVADLQKHAKEKHGADLTVEQAKGLIKR